MNVKLLTEHHLEFLSLKGGCTGSSKSIHVKMPHCWKSHVTAHVNFSDTPAVVDEKKAPFYPYLLPLGQKKIDSIR